VFLDDPRVPLDNNGSERALRRLDGEAVVPADLVDELATLGTAMGLDEEYWNRLARR
jgi:hypothetical protein